MEITELAWLSDLEDIGEKYSNQYGVAPINLSDWNPSSCFKDGLNINIPKTSLSSIDYFFSYELPNKKNILERLGVSEKGLLITHSGSAAITATVSVLKQQKCKAILILCPHYFTVPYALGSMEIKYDFLNSELLNNDYKVPENVISLINNYDAIWITDPVYCTSRDYDQENLNFVIKHIPQNKLIILDECLKQTFSKSGGEDCTDRDNIIRITSPHKSVCVNGIKFGVVIFSKKFQGMFDEWSDVWQGCLPKSSVIAVEHYLSNDFEVYKNKFIKKIHIRYMKIKLIVDKYENIKVDDFNDGYLVTIYVPDIEARKGVAYEFMLKAAYETGAIFIAGKRNRLPDNIGFSFRVNLAALTTSSYGALVRLVEWLSLYNRAN